MSLQVRVTRRTLILGLVGLAVAVLVVLAATQFGPRLRFVGTGYTDRLLRLLTRETSVVAESKLGVWYASELLLLVSALTVVCFLLDRLTTRVRRRDRYLSGGWLVMSLLFLGMSLDELAAIHERASDWVLDLAVPISLAAIYFVAFAWIRLRRCRWALGFIVVGTLLFLTVPIQEHFESVMRLQHRFDPDIWHRPPFLTVLEEGSELFATLCFVIAASIFAVEQYGTTLEADPAVAFAWSGEIPTRRLVQWLLIGFALLASGALLVEYALPPTSGGSVVGHEANWFPAIAAQAAAAASLQPWLRSTERGRPGRNAGASYLFLSLFCLILAADHGSGFLLVSKVPKALWGLSPRREMAFRAIIVLGAVYLAVRLGIQTRSSWSRLGAAVWATMFGVLLLSAEQPSAIGLFVAHSILLLSLVPHLESGSASPVELTRFRGPQISWERRGSL